MKKLILLVALFSLASAQAAFLDLNSSAEFKALIKNSTVPVVVQFAAEWCGPCQDLKRTFKKVAPSYTDDQVLMAYVDADENSDLKSYLQGGYPTVRTFSNGALTSPAFVGSQSEAKVRTFINGVINADWAADEEMEVGPYCR